MAKTAYKTKTSKPAKKNPTRGQRAEKTKAKRGKKGEMKVAMAGGMDIKRDNK